MGNNGQGREWDRVLQSRPGFLFKDGRSDGLQCLYRVNIDLSQMGWIHSCTQLGLSKQATTLKQSQAWQCCNFDSQDFNIQHFKDFYHQRLWRLFVGHAAPRTRNVGPKGSVFFVKINFQLPCMCRRTTTSKQIRAIEPIHFCWKR